MANVKDEGKKMDPLFPRLHISDAEKGGIRTPPRNKMSFNVPSQTAQRCISGSVSPILPLSKSNGGSLVPPSSSYHDTGYKRSVFSSFGHSRGSTRMATRLDSYHSSGVNLNISLTTVKQTIETTKCQTLCNTGQLKRGDYSLFKPQDIRSTRNSSIKKIEDEDDYLIPSLSFETRLQNTKQMTASHKQLKLTDKEMTQENNLHSTTIKDIDEEPVPRYSDRVQYSEMLSREISPPNPKKRSLSIDEPNMLHNPNIRFPLKRKAYQENMAYNYKDGTKSMTTPICPLLGDNSKTDRSTHEVITSTNQDHPSINLEDSEKNGDALEINNVSGYSNITPEEVSEIIGPEEYCRARRVIIQQQREFQSQLFELHRLTKVQKLLAEAPELLIENNFHKRKKYPSEDIYPHIDHHKKERYLSFPIDGTIKRDMEKRYTPNLIDLPPPPLATSPKQSPWCFLPPPGNQWLVPVRSPSEGLVYKPYTGHTPPPVGLMTPVYGMTIPPSNGDHFLTSPYSMNPTSYNQGISVFPSTPLFTSYGLPTIEDAIKYNVPIKTTTCKENDHLQVTKDELPLFPTTPMVHDTDKSRDEKGFDERIKAIKVIPRNPKMASESTARIVQFIQEERKNTE